MNVLLLSPGKLASYEAGYYQAFYPRLGIRILAEMLQPDCNVEIVEYERVDDLTVDDNIDLVGISILTPFAPRAYAIADMYRKFGVPVVLGGMHPSLMPEEAAQHADAVVVGEAETVWPGLIEDAKNGRLQQFYRADRHIKGEEIPRAKRLPTDESHFKGVFHMEAGRGCKIGCDFCIVPPQFGNVYSPRPVDAIISEAVDGIKDVNTTFIAFTDNLLGNPSHALKVCERLKEHEMKFTVEGDYFHLNDASYLKTLKESGCEVIYIETKAYSQKTHPEMWKKSVDAMEKVTDAGIQLTINFTIGYDDHDISIVDDVWELADRWSLAQCFVQLLSPWPGTPLFKKLEQENRIITQDWSRYNNQESVYTLKQINPEQLIGRCQALAQHMIAKQSNLQ